MKDDILFLSESNAIEGVYDDSSLKQAKVAWDYLIEEKEMSTGVVLKTHKILMLNQPGLFPNEKGYFREYEVSVGRHICLNHVLVREAIETWCKDMNVNTRKNYDSDVFREHVSKKLHVVYEKIHPFVDGNGRTGRMFMNWWRIRNGLPILVVLEKEKHAYYDWFR